VSRLGLATVLCACLMTAAGAAQDSATVRWARVSYVSGDQIYVTAGRDAGLTEGAELSVVRGDSVIATLRVRYLSSKGAACEIAAGTVGNVVPGDPVRFVPGAEPTAAAGTAATDTPAPPSAPPAIEPVRRRPWGTGLRGRIAARYVMTRTAPDAGQYAQPAIDLRLTGTRLGGTAFGIAADVRARSARSQFAAGGTSSRTDTDVYQLVLLWQPARAPVRAALGRQYVAGVSSILLLDGLFVEVPGRYANLGVFGGTEPEDLAYNGAIRDYGGYLQLHSDARSSRRGALWAVTMGAVGSYRAGDPNREFGFLQAMITTPGVTLRAAQEVDLYRGMRLDAGEQPLSFTSSYALVSFHPRGPLRVDAGFDNRRTVRLYRDVTDPVTAFDDRYRQGAWGGASLAGGHFRLRVEGRSTAGGTAGRATALTGMAGVERIGRAAVGLSVRSTRYESGELTGWLHALRVAADPLDPLHLELSGGLRQEDNPPVSLGTRRVVWYGGEADVGIGRAWYLVTSLNRETGPDGRLDQVYLSLSYRF